MTESHDPAAKSAHEPTARASHPGQAPQDPHLSVAERLATLLDQEGLEFSRTRTGGFVVVLPGAAKLRTTVSLSIGRDVVVINAFVCRRPDENHEAVYRWMLKRNAKMFGVAFALDRLGDIYLVGRIPTADLSGEDLDRLLGSVLSASDESFNQLLRLGYATAIRREYAWRVARGESLANLAAFSDVTDPLPPGALSGSGEPD